MTTLIQRLRVFITAFYRDTAGAMLPYVALMMIVFMGLGSLALDAGRYWSLQTQMQAIADALAIAGARELDGRSDSETRATSAVNNLVSNGLTGLGYSGTIGHSISFYSALPVASAGFGGTSAASPQVAKFVGVTVNPVTIPTILPRFLFQAGSNDNVSAAAQAIAGFTARAICDMPPVFICNPYETSGMTDAEATTALRNNLADPTVTRKMMRMDRTATSPGHFGFLVPPDGCTGANCLRDWIAKTHPNSCYSTSTVDLNTGAVTSVNDAFNVRFDMYKGSLNYSADYAPSVNVRKGFNTSTGNWCNASEPSSASNLYYTTTPVHSPSSVSTTGTTTTTGNNTARKTVTLVPATDWAKVVAGQMISSPGTARIPIGTDVSTKPSSGNILMTNAATASGSGTINTKFKTSGLPLDSNMYASTSVIFGNGDWDCLDYWNLNHTAARPPGCTSSNPTISRYQVYRYEITNGLVGDWSGNGLANTGGSTQGNGESGAPYCAGAGNGVDTATVDRRVIHAAIINCLAQSSLITGGSTANNIPVADFGKFFMTQPIGVSDSHVDPNSIYGEMTGLVSSLDQVRILNQVQLYR